MKSIAAFSKVVSERAPAGINTTMAKKLLLSRLTKLENGHLSVEDNGEIYSFGEPRSEAALIAEIVIHDSAAYRQILLGGATGAGEAYMLNYWSSPETVNVIRIFVANKDSLQNMDSWWSLVAKLGASVKDLVRVNSRRGSKKNISAHYDLSNHFFSLFLDQKMMYSSAIFPSTNASLEEAATYKLEHICQRLRLTAQDHLLEIGSGWGGMATYAAKKYGCRVTTTTISAEQYELAKRRVVEEGLEDKIEVLQDDYRDLSGSYDKLVSIEMVEAVGFQFYKDFFSRCSHLLKPNGLFLMQAITVKDRLFKKQKRRADFIRKYIFPGGCLPSNEVIMTTVAKVTDMHLVGLDDITFDYARTLKEWRQRFFARIEDVNKLGFDDTFVRMWDFYLCYCEGGFSEREINTSQFVFAKPQCFTLPDVVARR